ncbi:MAG: recombination mediator RecR [Erysipelotrichales bacterium]|nr:recombination mediator RecR [Erysipelotrichales bacterium]
MDYPKAISDLIESFALLPGIGMKSAERFAFFILTKMNDEDINRFGDSLLKLKEAISRCPICANLSDQENCAICDDTTRDPNLIMVVEDLKDVIALEKTKTFKGKYHVLNGLINLSKGIGPQDINVEKLLSRLDNAKIEELILATNATIEGEMTAKYIKNLVSDKNINVSRIAYGIPVGGDLQYADLLTIAASLEGRKKY